MLFFSITLNDRKQNRKRFYVFDLLFIFLDSDGFS
jgi:hypothetical protein